MIEKINSIERDNEDETKWSLNSNDSQDEGFSFQSKAFLLIFFDEQIIE